MNTNKCPICTSSSSETLFVQSYSKILRNKIVSCDNCGFVFVRNANPQSYYNQYYKDLSKYEYTRDQKFHDTSVEIIAKHVRYTDKILDVGCSTGHLLYLLKKKGYKNLMGVDPAPECRIVARKQYNVIVKTETIDSFKSREKFDFIILATVLEHLSELKRSIEKITTLLAREGKFFISVPNASRFYEEVEEPFYEFSPEHINFFSPRFLEILLVDFTCIYLEANHIVIYSVWKKTGSLKNSVRKYIKLSNQKLNKIQKKVDKLPKKTIVWGAGALTKRLLYTSSLRKKIFILVDRNAKIIEKNFENIKVISPNELVSYPQPILISSFKFKDKIINKIKSKKLKNKIITF